MTVQQLHKLPPGTIVLWRAENSPPLLGWIRESPRDWPAWWIEWEDGLQTAGVDRDFVRDHLEVFAS